MLKGDVGEEPTRLKHKPEKEIAIPGSRSLVWSPLRAGILDENRLQVHPIMVGTGKRRFGDGGRQPALTLVDSRTFRTGVVYRTDRPAGR